MDTNKLFEDAVVNLPTPGNTEIKLTPNEEEKTLVLLNSIFDGLFEAPSINPYYMLNRIKDRVKMVLGLGFEDQYFTGDSGVKVFRLIPLNHYSRQHTLQDGHNFVDNGYLKRFPHGLNLKVYFLKVDKFYHLQPTIEANDIPEVSIVI
jgi:hypothetical protein